MRLFGVYSAFYKRSNCRILCSNRFLVLGNYSLNLTPRSKAVGLLNEDVVSNTPKQCFASFTKRRQMLASDIPPVPLVDEAFGKTFLDAIWRHFIDDPQRIAMINAHDEQDRISFGHLFINSQSIATFLRTQGFGHGDVCAVVLPNCWQYMAIFGGILIRSGSMSGVNYNFTLYEMKRQFDDSHTKIVFCLENNAETVLNALAENNEVTTVIVVPNTVGSDCGIEKLKQRFTANCIIHFNSVLKIKPDNFVQTNAKCNIKSDLVLLPYSSGTTGHPKGVMISHFNFGMMMRTFSHHFAVRILPVIDRKYDYRKETQLDILPFYHIYGIGVIVNHLLNGSTAVIMKSFEANLFCKMLEKYRCKFAMIVPPIMIFLAKHPLVSNYDLSSLKMTVSGAAPAGKELCEELLNRLPAIKHVVQGYGMTELSLCSHLPVLDGVHRFDKAGKLMPNFELKIVDMKTGNELEANKPGELCIRSPTVMVGYLGNPTATAETFTEDGFLRTGDIAYVDKEGFLCVVDRLKELIKVSGYQVAPAELEDILLSHPKVHDCAVTGISDIKTGEAPKAFIVKKDDESSLTAEEFQEYVKERVVYYKRLKSVEFVDSIPKSPSGKILRRVLRDRANTSGMKGKNEITDAAAVALVVAYKQHELYMVQSDDRGERTDGWKRSREKWEAITADLNIRFELSINTDQWKKKLSNIKTNVKRKSTEKCDETDSSRRVNWSAAELEYDSLFPSRSSNSPTEMETYTASDNNYVTVNAEPSCSMSLGTSLDDRVLANLTSQLIDDVDSISDIKNIIVSKTNNNKNKSRGMKRKFSDESTNYVKYPAPNSILSATTPFMMTPNIGADSNTPQQLAMFIAAQQQFNNMFLNNNDGCMINNSNKNKATSDIYKIQLQAANRYLEAANIQKTAAEQFMLTVTKLTNSVAKFETLVSNISNGN